MRGRTLVNGKSIKPPRERKARGTKARKKEKERKKLVQYLKSRGQPLPIGIEISIRDPEKNPPEAEREALLPHISLGEKLNELRPPEICVLGQAETEVGEAESLEPSDSEPVSDEIESIEGSSGAASRSKISSGSLRKKI